MSKIGNSVKPRRVIIPFIVLLMGITGYLLFYNYTYSNLTIKTDKVNVIEYGTENYNLKKFIKSSNGKIVEISKTIDTSKVGKQKVDVTLEKYNITRKRFFYVDVVDTVAPVISLKEDTITITEGESYDIFQNIASVDDVVDGSIDYQSNEVVNQDTDSYYYTVNTDFDNNNSGSYQIEVKAVDKSNNVSTSTFTINVEKPQVVYRNVTYAANAGVNNNAGGIVGTAYSLLGSPYVSGGNSPAGFDCSGFVQYVYSQNGVYVSRSASTQAYDGVGISLESAQPGDIIVWGYGNGAITHSTLYVGDGLMIHAANPSMGVILSGVQDWLNRSGTTILYVRRVAS